MPGCPAFSTKKSVAPSSSHHRISALFPATKTVKAYDSRVGITVIILFISVSTLSRHIASGKHARAIVMVVPYYSWLDGFNTEFVLRLSLIEMQKFFSMVHSQLSYVCPLRALPLPPRNVKLLPSSKRLYLNRKKKSKKQKQKKKIWQAPIFLARKLCNFSILNDLPKSHVRSRARARRWVISYWLTANKEIKDVESF